MAPSPAPYHGTFALLVSMKADARSAFESEIPGVVSESGEPSSS
jgi:hypothetical protein